VGNKVEIICYKHGSFFQRPNHHLKGHGCPRCMADKIGNKFRSNLPEFVSKAKQVHGNLYDYSKSVYRGQNYKIEIVCNKHHKSFWQTAGSHLRGVGCPWCAWELITSGGWMVDKGSIKFRDWLKNRGYNFQFQYHIPEIHVSLDFYDPSSNIIIEYDSKYHHFKPQREKDRKREEKIIRFLRPTEFWRIDEKTKTVRNILVG
jgi:hypothetical protein